MVSLPIKGWPGEVVGILEDIIADIIERREVEEFYIGRTNNMVSTRSRHDCDEIFGLYETDSADNAIEVEHALIKTFFTHPKGNNDNDHGGGGASDEYVNHVYIALWHA